MSLIDVVSSLPIRPIENPFIGFYSIPVLLDLIAKITNLPFIYSVNQLGMIEVKDKAIKSHIDDLQGLQVDTSKVITDNQLLPSVNTVFYKGLDEGWIVVQNRKIFRCNCGRTEGLYIDANLKNLKSRRVYDIFNGEPKCKICCQIATPLFTDVYLLKIQQSVLENKIPYCMQDFATKDLLKQIEFFRGKELLLSRTRVTECPVIYKNNIVYLDIDFLSMIYLFFLKQCGQSVKIMPIGYKMSKQLALTLILSELLGVQQPKTIIYLPYFSFSRENERLKSIKLSEFMEQYGYSVLRLVLAFGFGANKKELTIPSSMIYQTQISLKNYSCDSNYTNTMVDLEKLWKQYSLEKMMRLVASIRKTSIQRTIEDEYLLQKILNF